MRYLGLDLGTKSLGLSLSDKTGLIASFYKNISYTDENKLIEEIKDIVEKEHVEKLVLGLPKNMDNSLGWRSAETIEFKKKLEEKLDKEIILEDERLTTKIAENMLIDFDLSRKKRKKVDIAKREKECSFWRLLISSNEKTNRQNQIRK